MIRQIKQSLLHTAAACGISSLLADSQWRQNRLLILGYHGVADSDLLDFNSELFMSVENFSRRLEILRETQSNVLPLGDAMRLLREGRLPPRSVVITFDDGFADLTRVAWPLLKSFGFPATVYVPTHYVDRQLPVFDLALPYILWRSLGRTLKWSGVVRRPVTLTHSSIRSVANEISSHALLHSLNSEAKHDLLCDLAARLGVNYGALVADRRLSLMSAAEVRTAAGEGLDVQLHTHRHRAPVNRSGLAREIDDNRTYLGELVQRPMHHLAYPSGFHDPAQFPWLRQLDVISATTCIPGYTTRDTNPLALPRLIDGSYLCETTFRAWVTGTAGLLPIRKPARGVPLEDKEAGMVAAARALRSFASE